MYKRIFVQALIAGILSAVAGIIYDRIYFFATMVDYSKLINVYSLFGFSLMVAMVLSFLYYGLIRWLGKTGELVFNFLLALGSFACVMLPLSLSLPLDMQMPELFPGLAVPMVFFPALAWFTIRPFFKHPV